MRDYRTDASHERLNYMSWHPGGECVDRWGVEVFGPAGPSSPSSLEFLAAAQRSGFPVMLGECTLRQVHLPGHVSGNAAIDH